MLIIPGDNTADFRVSVCPILTNMDDDLDESAVTGANRKGVVWNFFKVSQDDDTHAKCNLCGASCRWGSRLPKKHAVTLATKTGDDADVVNVEFRYIVIVSVRSFGSEFRFRVSVQSFGSEFRFRVSVQSFGSEFRFRVSVQSFGSEFRFRVSVQSFGSEFRFRVSVQSFGSEFRFRVSVQSFGSEFR